MLLAAALGVSRKRVANLCSEGMLFRDGDHVTAGSVRAFISRRDADQFAHRGERTRLTRVRADLAEAQQKRETGQLVVLEEVAAAWAATVSTIRTRFLALPTRRAPQLAHAETAAEMGEIIWTDVYSIRELLARSTDVTIDFANRHLARIGAKPDMLGLRECRS